jgi:hypothetical protein
MFLNPAMGAFRVSYKLKNENHHDLFSGPTDHGALTGFNGAPIRDEVLDDGSRLKIVHVMRLFTIHITFKISSNSKKNRRCLLNICMPSNSLLALLENAIRNNAKDIPP